MIVEESCGAIVYKIVNNKRKYAIIQSIEGIYGFPKGHIEKGESKKETALREVKEEIGIDGEFVGDFKINTEHPFFRGKEERLKRITYFIMTYENGELMPQEEELLGVQLMDYDEAINKFQYDDCKQILKKVDDYLNNMK